MRSDLRDDGMVTAELAAALPVLVVVLAAALAAVAVAGARVRAADVAREAARASARADGTAGSALVAQLAPSARVRVTRSGDLVTATATLTVHPLAAWLPAVTVVERAVAMAEPP
jgi:hypothetical protein